MLDKLIRRPVAVTMVIIAVLILGGVSLGLLPVSLMPDVDIPQITIQVSRPGASARDISKTVVEPLRSSLLQTSHLKNITCRTSNGGATLFMEFEQGIDIDMAFIEVNEKVDRVSSSLPEDMDRPRIIKASASDIPVFFVDMYTAEQSELKMIELSRFAKEVICKRFEQIPEIALVDVSGLSGSRYTVRPDMAKLRSAGADIDLLEQAIRSEEATSGNLSVREGDYTWNISFKNELLTKEDIENIHVKINDRIYLFSDLAEITEEPQKTGGLVRSDGNRCITFAVIKQADARMSDLQKSLDRLVSRFEKDYPDMVFKVSRSQTELLEYSIGNLKSNIITGALLAVLIIFLFLGDFKSPLLVTITIPLTLVITMLLLYLLGISINIISLSGLILGVGMMVDNSIIVIDNITQMRERGVPFDEAIVRGTNEVITPMLSSVLTTCSVFVPLIFLSGVAGALFYDQAMAVTVGLFASLFVAILVIPVYYRVFYSSEKGSSSGKSRNNFSSTEKTAPGRFRIHIGYDALYEKILKWFFRHSFAVWCFFLACIPASYLIYSVIDKSELPPMTRHDVSVRIDWNEPVNVMENDRRIVSLMKDFNDVSYCGIMAGTQDFLLSHTEEMTEAQAEIYVDFSDSDELAGFERKIKERIASAYPMASVDLKPSDNIFNLIFPDDEPDMKVKIIPGNGETIDPEKVSLMLSDARKQLPDIYIEPVMWQEQITFVTDPECMTLYGVDYSSVSSALREATGNNVPYSINKGGYSVPIVIGDGEGWQDFLSLSVKGTMPDGSGGVDVPLSMLVKERRTRDVKTIYSGPEGEYYPVSLSVGDRQIKETERVFEDLSEKYGYKVSFEGAYYSGIAMVKELAFIFLVSVLLLFFILAAQFESLVQPFIIMSEIVIDLFGALFALWICGAGINLMSLIGIVVMCGIIINDSILKVDTINRLRREGCSLLKAILLAGKRRLKPILMTSLTTILAIAPFLVRGDMGSDLQYPLSLALIGGMVFGTLVSIFYIPLFYYEIYRRGTAKQKCG